MDEGRYTDKILEVRGLSLIIGEERVVDNISFSLTSGSVTSLVGESGSGKTLTALSLMGLLPEAVKVVSGEIIFNGKNILSLKDEEKRRIRGEKIAIVFQEPFTALNPTMRVGDQVREGIIAHKDQSKAEVDDRIKELFDMMKLQMEIYSMYPHELSGGMRQRILLAMAISCRPEVLILDEPTTALDVSVQKHILDLIRKVQREFNFAILFITHDFSIVNMMADYLCVMNRGKIIESGEKDKVLSSPEEEYTRRLISCIPRLGDTRRRLPV